MLWLQNYHTFNEVALFDPAGSHFDLRQKTDYNSGYPGKTNGFFAFLDGKFAAIYVCYGEIKINLDGNVFDINNLKEASCHSYESKNFLYIESFNGTSSILHYHTNKDEIIDGDTTPFIDDESFNFGLFLVNIAKNQARQAVFKEVNG